MAYGRRRSTYRRKGRRSRRTLSTRRIFNNKGAKAQAAQIYALRKSVSRVRRQCAPEVKVFNSPQNTVKFAAYTEANIPQTYRVITYPLIDQGTTDDTRIGSKIKLLPTTFFLNGIYRVITNSSNGIPLYNVISSKGCGMRVVAIQNRISRVSTQVSPSPESIFDNFETSTNTVLTMANLNNPFIRGITTDHYILYDKVFYFNDDKPLLNLKMRIIPKIKHLTWQDGTQYPRGQITLYVMFGGLQSTSNNLNESDYNQVEATYWIKMPFTDA